VRGHRVLKCMGIAVCAALVCPPLYAQSVADAARAAKEKKKKQADSAQSQDTAKPKVYTNDEIPEAKSSAATSADAKATSPTAAAASGAISAGAKGASAQDSLPHGPDSVHVDFKFTTSRIKRPGTGETLWMVKNTSDHFERIMLKTIITGPCNYRFEKDGSLEQIPPGGGETDNIQVNFVAVLTDCPGTYRVELRASVGGKAFDSASDTISVE
jgi:hypothetical protein